MLTDLVSGRELTNVRTALLPAVTLVVGLREDVRLIAGIFAVYNQDPDIS
jgi:hypothetical protein